MKIHPPPPSSPFPRSSLFPPFPSVKNSSVRKHSAFTLIELLTVIAIIGILAGFVIGGIAGVRKKANQVRCLSNLRQMGLAIIAFTNDNKDKLPHNSLVQATPKYTRTGKKSLGHHLAAYLDQRRPEDLVGSEETLLSFLLCPQRLAADPDNVSAHFVVQCTATRNFSNGSSRPFGTDTADPIRYAELQDFGGPSRVWALIEADQGLNGTGWGAISGSTWFPTLPATPAHGGSRVVLFFDGRTQLMKGLPPRPE